MVQLNIKQFKYGVLVSAVIAVVLLGLSIIVGKNNFFLLLNYDLGNFADYFFAICTNGGDGSIWILALLATLFILKQPKAWPLLVSGFIISTILTQVPKNIMVPGVARPWVAIPDHTLIHHVPFVEPLHFSSFPSGHTMTAFCIYLSFCLLLKKSWWLYAGLAYALIVGYSRIYLAQHFPLDVGAGIVGGIISTWLSLVIQRAVYKEGRQGLASKLDEKK